MRKSQVSKPVTQGETPEERVQAFKNSYRTFYWDLYPWQERALKVVRQNNTTAVIASNKIGKTAFGVNVAISWALGYEPWCPVVPNHPLAVEVPGGSSIRCPRWA